MDDNYKNAGTNGAMSFGFCFGFIHGFVEGSPRHTACVPDGSTAYQNARILIKWSEENPEALHAPRFMGLGMALSEAYSCK